MRPIPSAILTGTPTVTPYGDEAYIQNFHTILTALREKRKLRLRFTGHRGGRQDWACIPYKLEYSPKDDKFRLLVAVDKKRLSVNLALLEGCALLGPWQEGELPLKTPAPKMLVAELWDERNALERCMLHFSHLEKQTERLDGGRYRLTLWYDKEYEAELLIRVLSFGPLLRVVAPDAFVQKLKTRLKKQSKLRA